MIVDTNSDLNVYVDTNPDGTKRAAGQANTSSSCCAAPAVHSASSCCGPVVDSTEQVCGGTQSGGSQDMQTDSQGSGSSNVADMLDQLRGENLNEYAGL